MPRLTPIESPLFATKQTTKAGHRNDLLPASTSLLPAESSASKAAKKLATAPPKSDQAAPANEYSTTKSQRDSNLMSPPPSTPYRRKQRWNTLVRNSSPLTIDEIIGASTSSTVSTQSCDSDDKIATTKDSRVSMDRHSSKLSSLSFYSLPSADSSDVSRLWVDEDLYNPSSKHDKIAALTASGVSVNTGRHSSKSSSLSSYSRPRADSSDVSRLHVDEGLYNPSSSRHREILFSSSSSSSTSLSSPRLSSSSTNTTSSSSSSPPSRRKERRLDAECATTTKCSRRHHSHRSRCSCRRRHDCRRRCRRRRCSCLSHRSHHDDSRRAFRDVERSGLSAVSRPSPSAVQSTAVPPPINTAATERNTCPPRAVFARSSSAVHQEPSTTHPSLTLRRTVSPEQGMYRGLTEIKQFPTCHWSFPIHIFITKPHRMHRVQRYDTIQDAIRALESQHESA